jgi:uncharacterized protein (DUF1697 family)
VSADERWVGLLRNVMLGREGLHRQVLLDLVAAAGGRRAQSHLTTGNVTFAACRDHLPALVERLELSLASVIGREEMIAVRPQPWLRSLVERNPFTRFDPSRWHLEVAFLSASAPPWQGELPPTGSTVVVEVAARELLAARPVDGPAGPHVNPLLERASQRPATSRAWSTLVRLAHDLHA